MGNEHTVTLRVDVPTTAPTKDTTSTSDRCWYLTESGRDGQEIGTVSACSGGASTSAARALGAIVVVSECRTSTTTAAGMNAGNMTHTSKTQAGIFALPANELPVNIESINYVCIDEHGKAGEPQQVKISG